MSVSSMDLVLSQFDRSVRAFADIKTSEGLAIISHFEAEERQSCALGAAVEAACARPPPGPSPPAVVCAAPGSSDRTIHVDPLMYWMVRRWLTAQRQEAVAAFLEDVCTFHELTTAHSRLKWARAIVASVESEAHCADIFAAMTGSSGGSGTCDAATVREVSAAWRHVVSHVSSATSGAQLLTRVFDIPYSHVVRHVVAASLPLFFGSREFAIYCNVVSALRRYVFAPSPGALPAQQPEQLLRQASGRPLSVADFERLGCVGAGSYGSVSVWRHLLTGTAYAVKAMDKRVLRWKASVNTVIRELACSLAVNSNYVASFDFVFSDKDTVYAGMRMYWRGDLERWLLAQPLKRFDEHSTRFYAAQLVVALKNLHEAGVIHRDIKASNVLIDDVGHCRLTDFGLAVVMHTCSQNEPSPERICHGEQSATITHCCLGCIQTQALTALADAAEAATTRGLSSAAGGAAAAADVARRCSSSIALAAEAVRRATARSTPSSVADPERSESRASAAASVEVSCATSSRLAHDAVTAGPASKSSFGSAYTGRLRSGEPVPHAPAAAAPAAPTSRVAVLHMSDPPKRGTSAGPGKSGGGGGGLTTTIKHFFHHSTTQAAADDTALTGGRATAEDVNMTTTTTVRSDKQAPAALIAESAPPRRRSSTGGDGQLVHGQDEDCAAAGSGFGSAAQRFHSGSLIHPAVVLDCTCNHARDDGSGWYKGRAGTSAYWCPQMLGRTDTGDRIAYGAECDWYSLGATVYALFTGRSPFSSGRGCAADNALTLDGRVSWPRGIFSRDAKALIAGLLEPCAAARLGAGPQGWRAVMAHPFFSRIDWGLLEAKVLPAQTMPGYRMASTLTRAPDKIAGQHVGAQAEEGRALEAEARSQASHAALSAEDEAVFAAATYTAPGFLLRGLMRGIAAQDCGGSGGGHECPASATAAAAGSSSDNVGTSAAALPRVPLVDSATPAAAAAPPPAFRAPPPQQQSACTAGTGTSVTGSLPAPRVLLRGGPDAKPAPALMLPPLHRSTPATPAGRIRAATPPRAAATEARQIRRGDG